MSKFKVGDRVVAVAETNNWGSIRKGDVGVITSAYEFDSYADFPNQRCRIGQDGDFQLATELTTKTITKTTMNKITTFVKNLALSADEKALRQVGFKTEGGDYTQESIDVVLQEICKERESSLISIANGIIAEEVKK